MDIGDAACRWQVSIGELLEVAVDDPNRARMIWKARNGWIVVVGQNCYICDPTRNGKSLGKVR